MSVSMQYMSLELELPWDVDKKQEEAFLRVLKRVLVPIVILFLVVPWLPVFESSYVEPDKKNG